MSDLPQTSWNETSQTLLIDFKPLLGFNCQLTISGWAQGLAASNKLDDEENQINLQSLGIQLIDEPQTAELGLWLNTFPQHVLSQLKLLPCYREALAMLACQHLAVAELLLGNRNLLWLWFHFCIADKDVNHNSQQLELFLQGVQAKQKWMMFKMGLQDSKLSIRLLREASSEILAIARVAKISTLFSNREVLSKLAHSPALNKKILYILTNWPWVAGKPVYFTLLNLNLEQRRIWLDTVQMAAGRTIQRLLQCKSYAQIERLHNRLAEVINRSDIWDNLLRDIDGQAIPFPDPPLNATENIVAITNPEMLAEEGSVMHHCVKSYVSKIQQQKYYVYRMLEPERLTVGIRYFKHKNIFQIEQVRGFCNAKASEESLLLVDNWFNQAIKKVI